MVYCNDNKNYQNGAIAVTPKLGLEWHNDIFHIRMQLSCLHCKSSGIFSSPYHLNLCKFFKQQKEVTVS